MTELLLNLDALNRNKKSLLHDVPLRVQLPACFWKRLVISTVNQTTSQWAHAVSDLVYWQHGPDSRESVLNMNWWKYGKQIKNNLYFGFFILAVMTVWPTSGSPSVIVTPRWTANNIFVLNINSYHSSYLFSFLRKQIQSIRTENTRILLCLNTGRWIQLSL